jgi:hypothetical protein
VGIHQLVPDALAELRREDRAGRPASEWSVR